MRHPVVEEDLQAIAQADLPWSTLEAKTVLISGANGFLPAYMVEALLYLNETKLRHGTRVIGLVRDLDRARRRFGHYVGRHDLELIRHDVTQPVPVSLRANIIVHAASQASPKFYGSDPVGTLSANVFGTHYLLTLARECRAEAFLFFSSGEVYGQPAPSQIPTRECDYGIVDPLDSRSCYAESKRMGETMCVSWWSQFGVACRIVRPFHTYGPGMRLDDGRVFADFVRDVIEGRKIVLKSHGTSRRAFCYLADAVAGFFTVLLKGENAQAYNVGNEHGEVTVRELAEKLVAMFPEKRLKICVQQASCDPGYLKSPIFRNCPDTSKIRVLGWQPTTSIEEGFRRTIRSFE